MAAAWMRGRWLRLAKTETDPGPCVDQGELHGHEQSWHPHRRLSSVRHAHLPSLIPRRAGPARIEAAARLAPRGGQRVRSRSRSAVRLARRYCRGCLGGIHETGGIAYVDDCRRTSLRHHLDRQRRRPRFAAQLPLTLDMSELDGNEKHADLPKPLPANARRPGTIRNGHLMLYGGDTLVVFYQTFQSSYSYTRLGRVDDPSHLAQALGPRGVRVLFSRD
jgi:hypothetical protein